MKKVLITGASGFVGRQCLVPLLERGYEVHALAPQALTGFEKDIVWHNDDFLDEIKITRLIETVRPTHCLHLAWYTEPGKYWSSPENLRWTAASISALHTFYRAGGQRFVGAGSCAEYDWQSGHCVEEITALEPVTLYGSCKNAVQKTLRSFSESVGMSSAWGRIFFLYGPHENPLRLVPSVITALLRNEPALCSHGKQIRDFMHVYDVANAFVCLLGSETTGPVNIASGRSVSIGDLVYKIAELMDAVDRVRLDALPAKNEPAVLTADVTRLQNEIGFHPSLDLDSGLRLTIDWWKKTLLEKER